MELWAMTDIWTDESLTAEIDVMRSAAQVFCGWRYELRYTDFTVFWEHTGMRKLFPKNVMNFGHWQKRNVEDQEKDGATMSFNGDKTGPWY